MQEISKSSRGLWARTVGGLKSAVDFIKTVLDGFEILSNPLTRIIAFAIGLALLYVSGGLIAVLLVVGLLTFVGIVFFLNVLDIF